jgi:hypothetical protein
MTIAQLLPHNHRGHENSLGALEQRIASEEGVSAMSLRRWRSLYERNGYAGLLRKPRADLGRSAVLHRHPELRQMIDVRLAYGLSPKGVWKSLLWIRGLHAPSYDVVLAYARGRYSLAGQSSSARSATL